MEQFHTISSIIGLASLIVVIIHLFMLYRVYKADHERRKKQSTIEYINSIRRIYKPLEVKLTKKFGLNDVINMSDMNDEIRQDIRELLGIIENLSTGVNLKVYDSKIINRMSGAYFINLYKRLQPYIDSVRARDSNSSYFVEFQTMIEEFKHDRRPVNKTGQIKYS